MTPQPLSILAAGMVTPVGLNAPAACAAIRCGITGFAETRFMDDGGQWLIGGEAPLTEPWRGRAKLVRMLGSAVGECLEAVKTAAPEKTALLVCVAEPGRPGRLDGLDGLHTEIQQLLGVRFHAESRVIPEGHVGIATAIRAARAILYHANVPHCLIAGADGFLVGPTLASYQERQRLLTSKNSNGFIPGEAAAAVLVGRPVQNAGYDVQIFGIGTGQEPAPIDSGEPLRADGLAAAWKAAFTDAGLTMSDVDYRITDISGEQYSFKEAALAETRIARERKDSFELWHPADCIGEVGAAIGPCVLGVALTAARKEYAPGNGVLCHFANDDGQRATLILRTEHRVRG